MQITRGVLPSAVKMVIYGPEGIGKSTLASQCPDPLFIDTEGSTKQMDVARLPVPETWKDILDEVKYVYQNPESCKTLVIDTADWAEMLCVKELLGSSMESIEDFGYGKGYVKLAEQFKTLLDELDKVIRSGSHVVITAHAMMRKFEQSEDFRNELERSRGKFIVEDQVVNVDNQGVQKGKNKVMGGERVMYTSHHNCWDAKNRFGLEECLPMKFESIASVVGETQKAEPKWKQLEAKMKEDGVEEFDLQNLVGIKGWATSLTPIAEYSNELLDFLLGDWSTVKEKINELKNAEEIPFV